MKMNEIEFKLSKEQYKTLVKVLYLADYCVSSDLISDFRGNDESDKLYEVLNKIYGLGADLDLPKSISLTSKTEVPFSEEDAFKYKSRLENDFYDIVWNTLGYEFAKRKLTSVLLDTDKGPHMHIETYDEINDRWIQEAAKRYRAEFVKNGISHLRFRRFYKLDKLDHDEQ